MDDFEFNLNKVLVETFNCVLKYEETALKKILGARVTIAEAHMIEAIGKQESSGEATVSNIAAILNIALPTATVAVRKLERKGFLKKVSCAKDGRRTIISLTDMGKKIEKAHQIFHARMVRNISAQFVDDERQVLMQTIKTLNEFFRAKVEA